MLRPRKRATVRVATCLPPGRGASCPPSTRALPFHTPPACGQPSQGEAARWLTHLGHPVAPRARYFLRPVLLLWPDHFASTPGEKPRSMLWLARQVPSPRPRHPAALPGLLPTSSALLSGGLATPSRA